MYNRGIVFIFIFIHNCYAIFVELSPYSDLNICNQSEYFSSELLKCKTCDINKFLVPSLDKHECICNEKSTPVFEQSSLTFHCEKCKPSHLYSDKINSCIKCSNGLLKKDNKTICKPCKENEVMVHHFTNGTFLPQTRCIVCTNGMVPSIDGDRCVPCPLLNPIRINGTLKCMCHYKSIQLGNICIPSNLYPEITSNKVKYYLQYSNGQKYESYLFKSQLKLNIFMCKLRNITACQILANLCVLTLFSTYSNSPCSLWSDHSFSTDPETIGKIPWIFYQDGEANVVLNRRKLPTHYSLNSKTKESKLNFTAVVLNLNGTVKEIKNMKASDLNLCPGNNLIKNEAFRFGTNYYASCTVEAKQFFDGKSTEFFIPYLQYLENNKPYLYAIPVLIKNLPQYRNNDKDWNYWRLVRRFFMFDTISSIAVRSGQAVLLRYVKSIEIRVRLRSEEGNGLIYPPLIVLQYGEITQKEYTSGKHINYHFSITYELRNNSSNSIQIAVGVLSALSVIYSMIQTWSYSRRSGNFGVDISTLFHLLLFTCGNLANVFFIVVAGFVLHNFIFYKGQNVVGVLLPTQEVETVLKNYVIAAFCLKIIQIIFLIYHQVQVNIFLIDWEKPKPQDTIPRPRKSGSPFTLTSIQQSISVWRSYFIANEWNEIQTKRKVNLLIHMIFVLFFLKIAGMEFWATADPELHTNLTEVLKILPVSFTCMLATGLIVYISAYSFQLCFTKIIYERFIKNCIQQFIDVCSLSNISVFIMSLERFGYYIHGRSAHGFADIDMLTMLKQLHREEQDLCAYRGLLSDTSNQTFTVGIPTKLRLYYNKFMLSARSNFDLGRADVSPSKTLENAKMESLEKRIQAYHNINKFLSAFLDHALKDVDYVIKDKTFLEQLFDVEFSECFETGILYTDNGHSFDKVLFYGNEFALFMFDIIVFSFVLVVSDNFVAAILFTVLVFEIIKTIRSYFGKKNIACKTIIDERFLI